MKIFQLMILHQVGKMVELYVELSQDIVLMF